MSVLIWFWPSFSLLAKVIGNHNRLWKGRWKLQPITFLFFLFFLLLCIIVVSTVTVVESLTLIAAAKCAIGYTYKWCKENHLKLSSRNLNTPDTDWSFFGHCGHSGRKSYPVRKSHCTPPSVLLFYNKRDFVSIFSWRKNTRLISYLCLSGMGPMPWTINSEIYPLWARSTGNACAAGVNWTFNILVSLTFLHLAQYFTYYGQFPCCRI